MYRPSNVKNVDTHVHDYREPKIFRIFKVHKEYSGTTGDKAFLYKACACGKGQVFDYGDFKKMEARLKSFEQ